MPLKPLTQPEIRESSLFHRFRKIDVPTGPNRLDKGRLVRRLPVLAELPLALKGRHRHMENHTRVKQLLRLKVADRPGRGLARFVGLCH